MSKSRSLAKISDRRLQSLSVCEIIDMNNAQHKVKRSCALFMHVPERMKNILFTNNKLFVNLGMN